VIAADDIAAFLASRLTETARIASHQATLEQAARQRLST
jgi:hypothetical protein